MRRIMVLNPKGGCGKSTIATNLASYYAANGSNTYLVDCDRQGSSMDWLEARPEASPPIHGVLADEGEFLIPHASGVVIMDAPAGIHGKRLKQYVKRTQTLLIPVLPSPMDMRATARFIEELLLVGRVSREKTRIAVLANRVREQTRIYHSLERFLRQLSIPFLTSLRDSQNYIRAAQQGRGIFELAPHEVEHDIEQWQPLLDWLDSRESLPLKGK
ncbi:MAG: ParA family protein [Gammaproteobacteria bacterium]|nr:ParA family protein [Gammaproteobacteria bacterium]MCW8841187.1 ParA family protein [Gammaproteobacteria bacterium]MCW8959406.1 ParA family protein [Gammaproteobacteria bacterium]MCW8973951.1 ParA family protein [Gammaproteobacteria bacterium]